MEIDSRQGLADFCLRQLGGGVVNIEISDDQIEDNIQMAISYYQEFHYDGMERDYVSMQVTPTALKVAAVTGFNVGDLITTTQGAAAIIYSIDSTNKIIRTHANKGVAFAALQTITNGSASTTINNGGVTLGVVDNKYFLLDDSVINVINIINTSSILNGAGDFMFNPTYQMMAPEVMNMVRSGSGSAGIGYFYGTMSYLGNLDFVLRKQKSYRFNRRINKLYLDIDWSNELNTGDFVAIEVYRTLDPELYGEVYGDMWLCKYTTALFKRQWGVNLSKYQGMQLPGGITYDGVRIFQEANEEIEKLEQRLRDEEPPTLFFVG